jgi:hypothetical protein
MAGLSVCALLSRQGNERTGVATPGELRWYREMIDPFVLMEDEKGFFYWSRLAGGSSKTQQTSAGTLSLRGERRRADKERETYEPVPTLRPEHG